MKIYWSRNAILDDIGLRCIWIRRIYSCVCYLDDWTLSLDFGQGSELDCQIGIFCAAILGQVVLLFSAGDGHFVNRVGGRFCQDVV